MADNILPSDDLIRRLAPLSPVPGRPDLRAHLAPDVFVLWQAWEKECGIKRDIPYWATAWPAALLAAKFLAEESSTVEGRAVLDLGCGGGLAGIAAAKAGARKVIANDIDPAALSMTARNAAANRVEIELRGGDLLSAPPDPAWQVLLVADLFYDKPVAEKMTAWLMLARGNGSAVYIADASRPFPPREGVRVLREERYATDVDLEGTSQRTVRLLAFKP